MTRFRFASLCLVALFCFSIAAPAMAYPPMVTPAGFAETLNSVIEQIQAWFGMAS